MKILLLILLLFSSAYSQHLELSEIVNRGDGMLVISETDSRVEVFNASAFPGKITPGKIFRIVGGEPTDRLETLDFQTFLQSFIGRDGTGRWEEIRDLMAEHLRDLKVVKIGRSRYYVVGRTRTQILGIHFVRVQTLAAGIPLDH